MLSKTTQQYFENKVIWISGASSGIGRALTLALAGLNCRMYISSRSEEKLLATLKQCARQDNIHILAGDLTRQENNAAICRTIKQQHGYLDIAILNAGTCEYVDTRHFDSSLFKRLMDTNFMSMVFGVEACLPLLRKSRHPHLAGMSSTAAYLGLPRSEAYGPTKAAIRNLFRALKVSLAPANIDVSVICPGFVDTELTAKNDFPMPCMISAEQSADCILAGMARRQCEIHFPKRFSLALKLISILPDQLQFRLLKKLMITP